MRGGLTLAFFDHRDARRADGQEGIGGEVSAVQDGVEVARAVRPFGVRRTARRLVRVPDGGVRLKGHAGIDSL